jgi:hypothetical protein
MREIDSIVVHCTATPEGRDVTAAEIDQWHKKRGWLGIGYHSVIRIDGTEEKGRDLDNDGDVEEHVGAHTRGHNARSLAVVYVGGLDSDGKPKDTRTPEQTETLFQVVERWMRKYGIPKSAVTGHYEHAAKACPCFDMDAFRNQLKARANTPAPPVETKPVAPVKPDTFEALTLTEIHQALNKANKARTPLKVLGPGTIAAVQRFQARHSMTVSGIVDKATQKALRAYL